MKRLIQWLALAMVVAMWPLSILIHGAEFSTKIKTSFDGIEISQINNQVVAFGENQKLGRVFYNKATYWLKLYQARFFALLDLNNYFFNFHPRENLAGNGNLSKFPFLALIYFGWGLFSLTKKQIKKWWWVGILPLMLAVVDNFDGWDMVLYLPILAIIISGWQKIGAKKYGFLMGIGLIVTGVVEYFRIFLIR